MNEQLGLLHMLQSGGVVIGVTAMALLVMSIISWTVIIVKGLGVQRAKKQAAVDAGYTKYAECKAVSGGD